MQFWEFRNIFIAFCTRFLQQTINNTVMENNNTTTNLDNLVAEEDFVPGEVVVKFKPEADAESINSVKEALNATVIETSPTSGTQRLAIDDMSVMEAVNTVNDNPALEETIEFIEPNFIANTTNIPTNATPPTDSGEQTIDNTNNTTMATNNGLINLNDLVAGEDYVADEVIINV